MAIFTGIGVALGGITFLGCVTFAANASNIAQLCLSLRDRKKSKIEHTEIDRLVALIYSRISRRASLVSMISIGFAVGALGSSYIGIEHVSYLPSIIGAIPAGGLTIKRLYMLRMKELFDYKYLFVSKDELKLLLAYENFIKAESEILFSNAKVKHFIDQYSGDDYRTLTELPISFNKTNTYKYLIKDSVFEETLTYYDDNTSLSERKKLLKILQQKALDLPISPIAKVVILNNKGCIEFDSENYTKSVDYFSEAMDLIFKNKSLYEMSSEIKVIHELLSKNLKIAETASEMVNDSNKINIVEQGV